MKSEICYRSQSIALRGQGPLVFPVHTASQTTGCIMSSHLDTLRAKHWMLVDDNEDILLMLSAMIERLTGALVECHNSPASALVAFAAAPEAYELVITDFNMPGMNGLELGQRLRALTPAQKIILASGNANCTLAEARAGGFGALLPKPFSLSALQSALVEAGVNIEAACPL
jgi:CheY-like chemotaxis protein